jgi:hypothetical protein
LHSFRQNLSEEELTLLTLLDEFGRQRKDEEELQKRLHDSLRHSGCRKDLGIDVEVFQKGLDRLEEINKWIVCTNFLDSLKRLDVTKIRM